MNKLIMIILIAFGFSFSTEEIYWKLAQDFNDEVLETKRFEYGFGYACHIVAVYDNVFKVGCNPNNYTFKLPYTWGTWRIVKNEAFYVTYSNLAEYK